MTAPENMLQSFPILDPSNNTACGCIYVLSPITTSFSITENGPMITFSPIIAFGETLANGWIFTDIKVFIIIRILFYQQ